MYFVTLPQQTCYYWLWGTKKHDDWVSCKGGIFIHSMKIGKLILKFKRRSHARARAHTHTHTHTHNHTRGCKREDTCHSDLIGILLSLKERCTLISPKLEAETQWAKEAWVVNRGRNIKGVRGMEYKGGEDEWEGRREIKVKKIRKERGRRKGK
jgi:hypothetical protein